MKKITLPKELLNLPQPWGKTHPELRREREWILDNPPKWPPDSDASEEWPQIGVLALFSWNCLSTANDEITNKSDV